MKLEVTRDAADAMLRDAALRSPEEACGLMLGRGGRIEECRKAGNVAHDARTRFEIDPKALFDAHRSERGGGLQLLGYYHSHPNGRADPSARDRQMASGDGKIWAIVADGMVRFFRDAPSGFEPLSYLIVDH